MIFSAEFAGFITILYVFYTMNMRIWVGNISMFKKFDTSAIVQLNQDGL